MQFIFHALDKPDALPRRLAAIDDHRRHLDQAPGRHGVEVLLSGPLMADDGETMIGSFLLLDAPNRAAIEALFAEDPLASADVWDEPSITAVTIRQNRMGEGSAPA